MPTLTMEDFDLSRLGTVFDPGKDLAAWTHLLEETSDQGVADPLSVIIASADTLLEVDQHRKLWHFAPDAFTDMYGEVANALENCDGLHDYFLAGAEQPYSVRARSYENPKKHLIMKGSEVAAIVTAEEGVVSGLAMDIRDRLTTYAKLPKVNKLGLGVAVGRATLKRSMANSELLPAAYSSVLRDKLNQLGLSRESIRTVIAAGVKLSERSEAGPAVITRLVRYAASLLQPNSSSLAVDQQ